MYRVEVTAGSDASFKVKSKDYEFVIDTKGKGASPPDTLLASLASCVGVYLRRYAEGARLGLSGFTITAEGEFPEKPPFYFKEIKVSINLQGLQLDERRKQALLEFIKNCPVHNTLKAAPQVEITVT